MRPDFSKVVTERPRYGMRIKQPKGYKRSMQNIGEDSPKGEKIRHKWIRNYEGKRFSDLIGPLQRWVASKVGQPWNNVYSEIRQVLSPKSATQDHIWDHIKSLVETDVIMIDGVPCQKGGMSHGSPLRVYSRSFGLFYVHPENGLLLQVPKQTSTYKFKKKLPTDVIEVDERNLLKKIDGVWYWLEVKPWVAEKHWPTTLHHRDKNGTAIFSYTVYHDHYDLSVRRHINKSKAVELYGKAVIPTSKRQLNKQEIKKLVA